MPIPSKQQILLRLAKKGDRSWDDIFGAWNVLYEFFEPKLERQVLDLENGVTWIRFDKWSDKPNFPSKQTSAARLSKRQVRSMMGSVCLYIANKKLEDQFETLSLSTDGKGEVDAKDEYQTISAHEGAEPQPETAAVLPKQQCLSILAQSQGRKLDDLFKAWDAVHEFVEPRLPRRV